jgi:hypothetical protein
MVLMIDVSHCYRAEGFSYDVGLSRPAASLEQLLVPYCSYAIPGPQVLDLEDVDDQST